ncbi:MAG: pyridoxal phosphate-dependent aminotransferase [Paludibacteraceae bacterium]|nr:pyridoxal phosphate-dependent aminotransferase [Paludibacteraceae bacterium]
MSSVISNRVNALSESQSLKMSQRCAQLRAEGYDVVGLTLGEPDAAPPVQIVEAVEKAMGEYAYSHYGPVAGMLSLRNAVCRKLQVENGLNYAPDEVVVTVGAKHAICNVILSLVNPGDEVIIPMPYWVSYSEMVKLAEGTNVFVRTTADTGYKMSVEQLKEALTPKTKLLLLCSPNNPTGSVYTHDELAAIAEVLEQYPDVFVVSDEIYEHINYAGSHCSPASFPSVADRVVIINGVSKAYAMTGYRIGWMACHNREIVKACLKLQGQSVTHASMIAQCAAEAAYNGTEQYVASLCKGFAERKAVVMELLAQIPEVRCVEPDGAFYAFPDVSAYYGRSCKGVTVANSDDMVDYLLSEGHVACVAGSAFGEDRCIRLSFATDIPTIREGIARIHRALLALK